MSPLLQPADCCVLLVDPRMGHVGHLGPEQQQAQTQALNFAVDVAVAGGAPIHIAYADAPPEAHDWLPGSQTLPPKNIHTLGATSCRWTSSGLNTAVAAERRTSLVVAGFWLEDTVTFLSIPALANGFEVFILMDATPARVGVAAGPAASRLLHAGAVPITTHQLVAEWTEASSDPSVRSALSTLIRPN
jgi:Isochorismatase family